ncbi:hypothetical protein [Arthrobacter sp. LAR12-1-1.1]|uniref:hypothetical protein n=1 Tax=Arthrobacter sp. LAR12-1-1.1 TaxID=3135215 RepID=UPI00341F2C70
MTRVPALGVSISPALSKADGEELLQVLEEKYEFGPVGKNLSGEWTELVGMAKDIAAVLGATNAGLTMALQIIEWRKKLLNRGKRSPVQLRAGGTILDLSDATDAQVKEWFSAELRARGARED